jgi:hypothetical protein
MMECLSTPTLRSAKLQAEGLLAVSSFDDSLGSCQCTNVLFQILFQLGMAAHTAISSTDLTTNFFDGPQLKLCDHPNEFCFRDAQTATNDFSWAIMAGFRNAMPFHVGVQQRRESESAC